MLTVMRVMFIEQILVADERGLCVALMFEGRVASKLTHFGYSCADISAKWLSTLVTTVGLVSIPGKVGCRLRLEDGAIVGIGHLVDDVWFDPRTDLERSMPSASEIARARVSSALEHINVCRARAAQRDLDPEAAGWTDDDVIDEALRLGWGGES